MAIFRNGKPIEEAQFDRNEPERADAMRRWHAERALHEGASMQGGGGTNMHNPRMMKHKGQSVSGLRIK